MAKYFTILTTFSHLDVRKLSAFLKSADLKLKNFLTNYLEGKFDIDQIVNFLFLSPKEEKIIRFIFGFLLKNKEIQANEDLKKDILRSLKLFLLARDFYNIKDEKVLTTLLLYEFIFKLPLTPKQIEKQLGKELSDLILEIKNLKETPSKDNKAFITAELINRIEDTINLTPILSKIRENPTDLDIRIEVRNELIQKFSQNLFQIKNLVKEEPNEKIQELYADFFKILNADINHLKKIWKIYIEKEEIEKEVENL
jgi:hypothetical protein